jgi:pSer/pThr/pTyr-binding forkhead associated (FHA) protein
MSGVSGHSSADAQLLSDVRARIEAERSGKPYLLFRDGDGRQQIFLLEPGSTSACVGRLPSCDLVLDWDQQVSRRHAQIESVGDAWVLLDDGKPRNGTFVNGERLTGSRALNDGDTVRFGATTTTFRLGGHARSLTANATRMPLVTELSTTQRRVLTALCRPYLGASGPAMPATDEQIADELFLSIGAVRAHLNVLYAKLEIGALPGNEARTVLVQSALVDGLISEADL